MRQCPELRNYFYHAWLRKYNLRTQKYSVSLVISRLHISQYILYITGKEVIEYLKKITKS